MKIGIYGGMANNMYVFASAMARNGADVCFIRDRSDRYPFSQPVWQDLAFEMDYEEIPRANYWPWAKWDELERVKNWTPPNWLYDPLPDRDSARPATAPYAAWPHDAAFLNWYIGKEYRPAVLAKMMQCDALLVCGVEGSILANVARRRFIILPHGGDLMMAAGVLPAPPWFRLRSRLAEVMIRRHLVKAYGNAVAIGVHEPSSFSSDFYGAEHFFRRHPVYFLAVPMTQQDRLPAPERRRLLNEHLVRLGATPVLAKYAGFVPSRVDYEWKGQDRLLHALAALRERRAAHDVHLIFSGWGEDLQAARQLVAASGLRSNVTFLRAGLSKPLLFEFFRGADFVVDQFIVGQVGTAALEAMACGAPVMMWVNTAIERQWGQPPVIQARTAEDIEKALEEIGQGRLDLDRIGRKQQEWVCRLHDPASVTHRLQDKFAEALAA